MIGACIVCPGAPDQDGYGRVRRNGRQRRAHRVAYEETVGPIPDGLVIDHLCRNRACVNPAHMEPVTRAENNRRGVGAPALNATKTECDHGHPFDSANTYIRPGGHRDCRACIRRRVAAYKSRRSEVSA